MARHTPMRRLRRAPWILAVLWLCVDAQAQDAPPAPGANPCAEDIVRLCGDQPAGRGRVRQCMEVKRDALSPACRASMEARAARAASRHARIRAGCPEETRRFCADVPERGAPLVQCLERHFDGLTESCRRTLSSAHRPPRWRGEASPGRAAGAGAAPAGD